jgi:hypothetical protein
LGVEFLGVCLGELRDADGARIGSHASTTIGWAREDLVRQLSSDCAYDVVDLLELDYAHAVAELEKNRLADLGDSDAASITTPLSDRILSLANYAGWTFDEIKLSLILAIRASKLSAALQNVVWLFLTPKTLARQIAWEGCNPAIKHWELDYAQCTDLILDYSAQVSDASLRREIVSLTLAPFDVSSLRALCALICVALTAYF